MSNLSRVHDFFFGNPQKIGVKKISSSEIISIMNGPSTLDNNFPIASKLGSILPHSTFSDSPHEQNKKNKDKS